MSDWGASGRQDVFELSLVDPFTLKDVGGELSMVAGDGSVTWGYGTDNIATASFTLVRGENADVDDPFAWTRLVRLRHTCTLPDGEEETEVLGTFFVDSCPVKAVHGVERMSASCYSTMLRFSANGLTYDWSRPKGYAIVESIRDLVEAGGGLLSVDADVNEEATHGRSMTFEIDTNQKEALDTVAGWYGLEIGVDDLGYITLSNYVAPAYRAASYDFEEGENCVYVAGYTLDDDNSDRVNRVTYWYSRETKDDDDELPLSSSATAELPQAYAYSYYNIGRWVDYSEEVNDPVEDAELLVLAEEYLYANCDESRYIEIEHAGVPGLRAGDVVTYRNSEDGESSLAVKCLVSEMDMSLKPGCPCKTLLKVVREL